MKKDYSIEYAHIYTNNHIDSEQKFSIEVLKDITTEHKEKDISLVVMVDDYSFPDTSFDYEIFTSWLDKQGFKPEIILRESQLIPLCDEMIVLIENKKLKEQISDYIITKKYPCSLFIATWYFLRLGYLKSPIFSEELISENLINILPLSFKPFEDSAFEIIRSTQFHSAMEKIENKYFEGRLIV